MSGFETDNKYVCLTFEESNILIENVRKHNLPDIIARLDNLIIHTSDHYLQMVLNSLLKKLQSLTPNEYDILVQDIENNSLLFPPNYRLPYVDLLDN